MDPEQARTFVAENHRAVMITRRASGDLQTSPVLAGVDDDGMIVISTTAATAKVGNLRRDPRAVLCVLSDGFYGPWLQIDGAADIVTLPEAMDGLIEYYRRISGEHPDWDDYRQAMNDDQRVLIRVSVDRVGPAGAG